MLKDKAIGIDVGGTNLRAALVSADGAIIKKLKETTTGNVMNALKTAIESLMDDSVAGIGMGVAGLINRKEKKVIVSPNIPAINGQDFGGLGGGVPVFIENDASTAALGEMWMGAGRDFESFVLLTLGTGIGGGFIHKGKLLDVAAEAGHMSIELGGGKCPCGSYGCLETYASARAITGAVTKAIENGAESAVFKDYAGGNIYKLTPEDIYKAAFDGDNLAREALKDAGKYLGIGIANLINIMSPEAVILAGGLIGAWDIYINEAVKEASKRALKSLSENIKILPASRGDDAGILGAAHLVFHGEKAYTC